MAQTPNFEEHEAATKALGINSDPVVSEGREAVEKPESQETKAPANQEKSAPTKKPEEGKKEGEDTAKETVPLAVFLDTKKDLKEAEAEIERLKKQPEEKKTETPPQSDQQTLVSKKVNEFAKKMTDGREDSDPEALAQLVTGILSLVGELTSKEKSELPEDVKRRLATLDVYEAEQHGKEQVQIFNDQWDELIPELKKLYPNADEVLLNQAKELMYPLARSEDYHQLPLDSIYFKKRNEFDAILKVAKGHKSGEVGRPAGEEPDESENEGPDFLSPDMSPEKLSRHQEKKNRTRLEGGKIRFS